MTDPEDDGYSWAFPGMAPMGHYHDGPPVPADLLVAVVADPNGQPAWDALAGWLADNGSYDAAVAVRTFWPAIADSLRDGMTLAEALALVARHAPGLARLARRIGDR